MKFEENSANRLSLFCALHAQFSTCRLGSLSTSECGAECSPFCARRQTVIHHNPRRSVNMLGFKQ